MKETLASGRVKRTAKRENFVCFQGITRKDGISFAMGSQKKENLLNKGPNFVEGWWGLGTERYVTIGTGIF